MFGTQNVPSFQTPDLITTLGAFPLTVQLSSAVLAVLTALAAVFVAALSVMLVYHWRRFPYEHDLFRKVERLYLVGVAALLAVAVVGIMTLS